jgi:hypothetical protein
MERTHQLSVSNQLVTNKITLLIDDLWLKHVYEQMLPFVEVEEILKMIDKTEVEICADCQKYQTEDNEVIMDVFKCYDQQEYCLNCCGCEDHEGEKWY